jgi:hypothetical protein
MLEVWEIIHGETPRLEELTMAEAKGRTLQMREREGEPRIQIASPGEGV